MKGEVAQRGVEHLAHNPEDEGSNPSLAIENADEIPCQQYHSKCGALCCKVVTFPWKRGPPRKGERITFKLKDMDTDARWYFRLHEFEVYNDTVTITVEDYVIAEGKIAIIHPCINLTKDLLCSGHPDNKPAICKDLTLQTAKDKKYFITPGCKYDG